MKFSLIICTYMRPTPLIELLKSVQEQRLYPTEIIIVDGSTDDKTNMVLRQNSFQNLCYYKVDEIDRGLTKQRNFGVSKISFESHVVCFLDDDIILTPAYFEELLGTYNSKPDALAVGGYIINEVHWKESDFKNNSFNFYIDGWMRKEPQRFQIRRLFKLMPDVPPGYMPAFSHGRSIGFLPPTGKIYPVEQLMGGVASYRREVFESFRFSSYFEGYGLYEDADFSLRLAKTGKLYVNTNAQLSHFHEASGRPNHYKYGKMVVRNGWYVWRVKYPNPSLKARFKWNATALLLTCIRLVNIFTTTKKKDAFRESLGRMNGYFSLISNKPGFKNK